MYAVFLKALKLQRSRKYDNILFMERLKVLKIFNSKIEAEIAKSFLASNNIESWIFADDAGNMYPSQDFVNGVRLMVGKNDFATASMLLNNMDLDVETEE